MKEEHMKNKLKAWFIGVILFSLFMGCTWNSTAFADSGKKELGYEFTNGLVLFKQNGKYGMLNKKGSVAVKPQYDSIEQYGQTDLWTG